MSKGKKNSTVDFLKHANIVAATLNSGKKVFDIRLHESGQNFLTKSDIKYYMGTSDSGSFIANKRGKQHSKTYIIHIRIIFEFAKRTS